MKIIAVAMAAFASLAAAVSTTTVSLPTPAIAGITEVPKSKSCFPQVQPILTTSIGPLPSCPPPEIRPCDPRCEKYHCCRQSIGCSCLDEVLDELERNESLQGDKDAALRNIDPQDIDLDSAANANFKCDTPCGAAKLGCCLMDTKAGKQCLCRKRDAALTIDEPRPTGLKQRSPNQECSPECEILLGIWEACLEKESRESCDKAVCQAHLMRGCDYPMCQLYVTCTGAQAVQTA